MELTEFAVFFLLNVIRILKYAILARVLISWIQVNPHGRLVRLIYEITEPVLRIIRNILPRMGMIDLSPLVAFFALDFLQIALVNAL